MTSIPKAKSVNQSFHTSAECAFLYAGLHTFVALQVNVTENNRILRDEKEKWNAIEDVSALPLPVPLSRV